MLRQISRIIHVIVLSEMERDDVECRCTCPSCGSGICVCAPSSRQILSGAWDDAGPNAAAGGVPLSTPRTDSPAAQTGLVAGDVIVSIDGRELQSGEELQAATRAQEPREGVMLAVHRASGGVEKVPVPPASGGSQ